MARRMKWKKSKTLDIHRDPCEQRSTENHEQRVADFFKSNAKNSLCQKCGEPISFKRLDNGKWCPTNPDGTDHFDQCKRVALRKAGKKMLVRELRHMTVPLGRMPVVENTDVPPWDESIIPDWRWCRGSKSVTVEVQQEWMQP